MSEHLERVNLLLQQSRYDMAETECRRALGADPNSAWATALLALSLSGQKKYKEATQAAQSGVALAPDWDYSHYIMASVLDERDRLDEAEVAVREAIRLDPEDADYFALLAGLHAQRKRWTEGLEAAERGLALDAEHVDSANIDAAIAAALAREPENAATHANRGWTLLESGDHQKAMEHFREALRLEADMEWARAGIVEALKARRLVYRMMLKYSFFMSRLSGRAQWGIIIGAVVLVRLLRSIARAQPDVAPFVMPVVFLYLVFVLMTWIAQPLFNLMLRLDRFGRLALSRDQTRGANVFGLCVACALLAFCVTPWFTWIWGAIGAAVFGVLVIPTSAIFKCAVGWPRFAMTCYTILLAALGVGTWIVAMIDMSNGIVGDAFVSTGHGTRLGIFIIGAVLSTWIGGALSSVKLKK